MSAGGGTAVASTATATGAATRATSPTTPAVAPTAPLDRPQAMRSLLQRTTPTLMRQAEQPPLRQLASALAAALRKGEGSVTINLRPENLGPMRVDLRVEGNLASAIFHPTTESARQLLAGSEASLRGALEARGLRVDRIDVAPLPESTHATTRDGVVVEAQERASGEDPRNRHEHAGAGGRGGSHPPPDRGADRSGTEGWSPHADTPSEQEIALGTELLGRIEPLLATLSPTVGTSVIFGDRLEAMA